MYIILNIIIYKKIMLKSKKLLTIFIYPAKIIDINSY